MVEYKCLNCGHEFNKYDVLYSGDKVIEFCSEECFKKYNKDKED